MTNNKSVLIVDDDITLCQALEAKFKAKGFKTTVSRDGDDAVKQLGKQDFSVIMLDLHMPNKDGFQVLSDMQETVNHKTPVFVITNLGKEEYCEKAIKLGAIKCFVKSRVTLKEVVAAVSKEVE